MKKMWFPALGDQVRHGEVVLTIDEVGTQSYIAWGGGMIGVRFTDHTMGIVTFGEIDAVKGVDAEPQLRAWVPDNPEAAEALRHAQGISIQHGIGSDVIHVRIEAANGRKALIKLFYNAKKLEHQREDEICWQPAETAPA